MFSNILVAVDGSDTALAATRHACALAKAFQGSVSAVYVIDPYPFSGVGTDLAFGQEQYLEAANSEADVALDAAKACAAGEGLHATVMVVEAHTVHRGIVETAESTGADLIVVGSHGRSGLEKLVLGSVTQRVLGDCHVPVLVVRD